MGAAYSMCCSDDPSNREESPAIDEETVEYPSSKYYVTNPWEEKPIILSRRGPASWEPIRMFELFEKCVDNAPHSVYWKKEYLKPGSDSEYEWKSWTRKEVYDLTQQSARAFIACGLRPWQAVSIIGFNSPEWVLAMLGCIHAGGICAGIYSTSNQGRCRYIAEHSKSAVAVVENKKQLDKFLEIRGDLKDLNHIVVWDMDEDADIFKSDKGTGDGKVIHWKTFMKMGEDLALNQQMRTRIESIEPGMCCTLIYTSGTTGPPKAVMISHDNVTWQARSLIETVNSLQTDGSPHSSVSYLPFSHIAGQSFDVFLPMAFCADHPMCKEWILHFARPTALKGTLGVTLKYARPTFFFGVPRVWEKIQEGIIKQSQNTLGNKVKKELGFDRAQVTATGAAPISEITLDFWGNLGFEILNMYGMSETCGPHATTLPHHNQIGTVGVPLAGATTLLQNDPHRDKPGHGEICMRGRHIMMGYMYDEDKSRGTIDDEGYVHSGDVGVHIEEYNSLKITGRIKELLITAGGENIAPVPIEDYLKAECDGISNVMVIGDRKKYLTALVTLKVQPVQGTMTFSNDLDGAAKDVDEGCKSVGDARKSGKWKTHIQSGIDKYNADKEYCVSNAQKVQYYRILDNDFGVESGELTATMKLKRPVVAKKYHDVIESMYNIKK